MKKLSKTNKLFCFAGLCLLFSALINTFQKDFWAASPNLISGIIFLTLGYTGAIKSNK